MKDGRPNENIALFFHKLSKDWSMGGSVNITRDRDSWPDSWKIVEFKTYDKTKKIPLLDFKDVKIDIGFSDLLMKRKTRRDFFQTKHSVTIKEISTFLQNSVAIKKDENNNLTDHRMHPSGGSRYPLEYYIYIHRSDELEKGLYHYNLKENCLEQLSLVDKDVNKLIDLTGYDFGHAASCSIFITAIFNRTMRKYGERGYRYLMLEAGHVGQNLYLACTGLKLSVVPAFTRDLLVEEYLGIENSGEHVVYGFLIG
jgi:SagB-type dehydrogenase family enzyme